MQSNLLCYKCVGTLVLVLLNEATLINNYYYSLSLQNHPVVLRKALLPLQLMGLWPPPDR